MWMGLWGRGGAEGRSSGVAVHEGAETVVYWNGGVVSACVRQWRSSACSFVPAAMRFCRVGTCEAEMMGWRSMSSASASRWHVRQARSPRARPCGSRCGWRAMNSASLLGRILRVRFLTTWRHRFWLAHAYAWSRAIFWLRTRIECALKDSCEAWIDDSWWGRRIRRSVSSTSMWEDQSSGLVESFSPLTTCLGH